MTEQPKISIDPEQERAFGRTPSEIARRMTRRKSYDGESIERGALPPSKGPVYLTSRSAEYADRLELTVQRVPAFVDLSAYFEFTEREREGLAEEAPPMWHGLTPLENITRRFAR